MNPIPFVSYAPGEDGVPRSVADFTYGYAHALADHVVRPVLFLAYSGEMQWRTRAGDEAWASIRSVESEVFPAHSDSPELRAKLLEIIHRASEGRWD